MKSWAIEISLVESGTMVARLASWRLTGRVHANSPERAIVLSFRKYKQELNKDSHLRRAKRRGGLRVKVTFLGEVDEMKMTEEEVRENRKQTGNVTTRKCDRCDKPITNSYLFRLRNGQEACSEDCRTALEEGTDENKNRKLNKETEMKATKKKTATKNEAIEDDVRELAVGADEDLDNDNETTDEETTMHSAAKTTKKAPKIEKTPKAAKPIVAEKSAKAAKVPKAPKAEGPLSPRAALLAVSYVDRFKGKFPVGHPLAIFLEMFGGIKGGKVVKMAALEKACPEGFNAKNMLGTLDWYGNPANEKEGGKGWGYRVKTDKEAGTVSLVKA